MGIKANKIMIAVMMSLIWKCRFLHSSVHSPPTTTFLQIQIVSLSSLFKGDSPLLIQRSISTPELKQCRSLLLTKRFSGNFSTYRDTNLLPPLSCCRWVIDKSLDRNDDDDVADLIMLIAEYNQPPTYIHSFQHLTFLQIFQIFHLLTKWLASSFFNIILINYFFLQLLAQCQYSSHRLIQALRKLCSIFLLLSKSNHR